MSATPTTCIPSVRRACDRNIVPNLPAPISPTVTGRPAALRSSNSACRFKRSPLTSSPAKGGDPVAAGLYDDPRRRSLRDAPRSRGMTTELLADRTRDERFVPALLRIGRAALPVHLRRAFERGRDVDTVAARKAFRAAQRQSRAVAIGRAVWRNGAKLVTGHDVRRQ